MIATHSDGKCVPDSTAGAHTPIVCIVMAGAKLRVEQWQVLRRLAAREMPSSEVAEVLGRRTSSVSRGLALLKRDGLVEPIDETAHAGPGQPKQRWRLTSQGRDALDASPLAPDDAERKPTSQIEPGLDEQHRRGPWPVAAGDSYVEVTAASQELPRLLALLTSGEIAGEASFVVRLDGDGHRYLFMFDRQLGARPAEAFAAALDAAQVRFSLGTVGDAR